MSSSTMSNLIYDQQWLNAREDLVKLLRSDENAQNREPVEDRREAMGIVLELYYRYRKIIGQLTDCHDEMIQPQLREMMGRILDCSVVRMLELRREMISLTFLDYPWPNDAMLKLKLTPDDMEIRCPLYNFGERKVEMNRLKQLYEEEKKSSNLPSNSEIVEADKSADASEDNSSQGSLTSSFDSTTEDIEKPAEEDEKEEESKEEVAERQVEAKEKIKESEANRPAFRSARRRSKMSTSRSRLPKKIISNETAEQKSARESKEKMDNAMLLLQSHERCRIAIKTFKEAKRRKLLYENLEKANDEEPIMTASGKKAKEAAEKEAAELAATVVQKNWRGYSARRSVELKRLQLEQLLGFTIKDRGASTFITSQQQQQQRQQPSLSYVEADEYYGTIQANAVKLYNETMKNEEERLTTKRGPEMIEEVQEELYQWLSDWYNEAQTFDEIPPETVGGSMLIVKGETRTPQEHSSSKTMDKSKGDGETDDNDDNKKDRDAENLGSEELWSMKRSEIYPRLIDANLHLDRFSAMFNAVLLKEPKTQIIMEPLREEICYKLHLKMRQVADKRMRVVLALMKDALKKDSAALGEDVTFPEPEKFPVIGAGKEPKRRQPKEKPAPERKDPLENVSSDDLFVELMRNEVIRECPIVRMFDLPGAPTYAYDSARHSSSEKIKLGDVRIPIMDYCVLSVGSRTVNELSKPLIKSVCLCGPKNAGQELFAYAACTELRATVFDLSPTRHKSRYKTKKEQKRLVNSVVRLAKKYAPSVILVEGEEAWLDSTPKHLRSIRPKRWAPIYGQIIAQIKAGDQILFLTTSGAPQTASQKFNKFHNKFIMIPPADYNSLYARCKRGLMRHELVDRHINLSATTKLAADIVPIKSVDRAVDDLLTIDRTMSFRKSPLQLSEIMDKFLTVKMSLKDLEDLQKFWNKQPLERKRRSLMKKEKEAEEARAAAEAAAEQKKKKK